jgi:hypothetical protein
MGAIQPHICRQIAREFLFDLGSELTLVSLRGRFRYRLAPPGGLRLRGTLSMRKSDRAGIFIAAFLLLSVVCMSAVKYGMSLRYAAFCEIPLCWLACSPAIAPQKAALPPWPWRQRRQRSPRHGRCPARRAWCDEPKRRIKHYCSRGAWPAFSFKNEAWASFHRSTCAVSAS